MYKIRVILDTPQDVFRTLLIDKTIHLEDLHFSIAKSFGFDGTEIASFYRTDDEWNQGEEIPLFDMSDEGNNNSMANYLLSETLPKQGDKLIYVYDFLALWTFYVEVLEITDKSTDDLPKTILSVGQIPEKAPEKEFKVENLEEDDDDEFDIFDDFDFNEY